VTTPEPIVADVTAGEMIGSLLACSTAAEIELVLDTVRVSDFADLDHRAIYAACARTYAQHREIDAGRVNSLASAEAGHALAVKIGDLLSASHLALPLAELALRVAREGAARDLDAARVEAIKGHDKDASPETVERVLYALQVAQARRDSLVGGIVARAPAARDMAEMLETEDPAPPEELVERLITRPGVVIAYGASGSGKSYALMAACLDLIGGGGCFVGAEGLQLRPRTTKFGDAPDVVLWVYGSEDPERRIRHRARELWASGPHRNQPMPRGQFLVASPGSVCLGSQEGVRWLRREIETAHATVVILDTVQSLTSSSLDTSDGGQVARWMVEMHMIRDACQVVLIPVCHTSKTPSDAKSARGKADSLLGSQAWRALADGMVMIDAPDGDASAGTLRLIKGKDVDEPIPPLRIGMDGDSKRFRPLEDEQDGEAAPNAPAARTDARIGRPKVFSVEKAVALRERHPDGLPWSDNAAMMALFGGGESQWFKLRAGIQRGLLALGHVVIDGRLRWGEIDTPKTATKATPETTPESVRKVVSGVPRNPSPESPGPAPLKGGPDPWTVSGPALGFRAAARLNENEERVSGVGAQTPPANEDPWEGCDAVATGGEFEDEF